MHNDGGGAASTASGLGMGHRQSVFQKAVAAGRRIGFSAHHGEHNGRGDIAIDDGPGSVGSQAASQKSMISRAAARVTQSRRDMGSAAFKDNRHRSRENVHPCASALVALSEARMRLWQEALYSEHLSQKMRKLNQFRRREAAETSLKQILNARANMCAVLCRHHRAGCAEISQPVLSRAANLLHRAC